MKNFFIDDNINGVYMPNALDKKYPDAPKQWGWQYVFPSSTLSVDPSTGVIRRRHISDTAIQKSVKLAVQEAGIAKHATVHALRRSFANLFQCGVDIGEVQSLLGHKHVETTMIYTHVMRNMTNAPRSPLDILYENDR